MPGQLTTQRRGVVQHRLLLEPVDVVDHRTRRGLALAVGDDRDRREIVLLLDLREAMELPEIVEVVAAERAEQHRAPRAVTAAATRPQGASSGALSTPLATFWLLAPADLDAARATLDKQPRLATARLDAAEIAQARRDNPVNAGMRAALRLVTSSALALAALGFAAATAGLALARHREAGILLALGTSPRQIRRAVLGERLVVLVLSTLVGLGAGVAAIWAIVALVIGSDGHPQVPAVHTEYGVGALVLFAGAVLALLAAVGLVVVGRTARDPADVLRAGEHA